MPKNLRANIRRFLRRRYIHSELMGMNEFNILERVSFAFLDAMIKMLSQLSIALGKCAILNFPLILIHPQLVQFLYPIFIYRGKFSIHSIIAARVHRHTDAVKSFHTNCTLNLNWKF